MWHTSFYHSPECGIPHAHHTHAFLDLVLLLRHQVHHQEVDKERVRKHKVDRNDGLEWHQVWTPLGLGVQHHRDVRKGEA